MFFDTERILSVRKMIIAESSIEREQALAEILPMQRGDFIEIFNLMRELPVNIRLLDPPLHEFLPNNDKEMMEVANATGKDLNFIKERCCKLHETNPMLGHRGSRLGITYPEIYEMQIRAIFEAYIHCVEKEKFEPNIELMVPLIATEREIIILKEMILMIKSDLEEKYKKQIHCQIGTMVELPRAVLIADKIAVHTDYFSYGTNDLTQTCYGMSRDDSASFINAYIDKKVFTTDPFVTLDQEGVGELIKMSAEKSRTIKPEFKLGICGEHGGDPKSIEFCHRTKLTYVSCSPFRVPIARLAAAQAAIKEL